MSSILAKWQVVVCLKGSRHGSSHQLVANLARETRESFTLEDVDLKAIGLASPAAQLARVETFQARWRAYAIELGLHYVTAPEVTEWKATLGSGAWP